MFVFYVLLPGILKLIRGPERVLLLNILKIISHDVGVTTFVYFEELKGTVSREKLFS